MVALVTVGLLTSNLFSPSTIKAATSNCSSLMSANNSQLSYNQLLQKQTCIQQALSQNQQNLKATQRQASDLQSAIANLNNSIGDTQSQIDNTQTQINITNAIINSLTGQITDTTAKINDLNNKLNAAYANLYELSRTSTIEMLVQSKSINDLLNQSQYIQSIQTDLQSNIATATSLNADLTNQKQTSEQQKASLLTLNDQLNQSKSSLSAQKSQKDYLLAKTQGDQAKYAQLLSSLQSEVTKISSDIYQKRLSLGGYINTSGNGGYPYANSAPDVPDQWGFLTRECTSYAAFAFQRNFGRAFNNTEPGNGSAWNWPALAHDQGYVTSHTLQPGDIISWTAGPLTSQWGHVAAVEAVFSQSDIIVSEYNWNRYSYTERRINPSNFGGYTAIRAN